MIASADLQRAIYTALNGVISVGVYDEVPATTPPPYVVIGETTEVPDDDLVEEGSEETVTLHVWDTAKSSLPVKGVMAEVDAILHREVFTLPGGWLAHITRDFVELFKEETDPGAVRRHAVMRYRARIWAA